MKWRLAAALWSVAAVNYAQPPAIGQNGVVNAASRIPPTLPGATLARGARFQIDGVRLAGSGNTRVTIESGGRFLTAAIRSADASRIEAVLPPATRLGQNTVVVERATGRSNPFRINVSATAVGLYSVNEKGWGQGKIDILDGQGRKTNSVQEAAQRRQMVAVLATGLGNARSIKVTVGGQPAQQPAIHRNVEPGLDEIRFRLPRNVPEGCYVPIYVQAPGSPPSNVVTIAIAPSNSQCRMPGGSTGAMEGQRIGVVGLGRTAMRYSDSGAITTLDESYGAYSDLRGGRAALSPLLSIPPENTCTRFTGSYETGVPSFRSLPDALLGMLQGRGLNAGRLLSIEGEGERRLIPATGYGSYWVQLGLDEPGIRSNRPLFLNHSSYLISGTGGPDVGEFSQRLTSLGALDWTNERDAAFIDLKRGLAIHWRPVSGANLILIVAVSTDPLTTATAICICTANPEAGQMDIASHWLSYFPQTNDIPGPPPSLLFVGAVRLEKRLLPVVRGLDALWTISSYARGRRVSYR